ncbi:hypothetical protein HN358_05205 [Candidatus Uhrbacteria bacterium]|jgi:hypothetical protein|nr:hypothetical protein [Candidatus Uhrbacteria bacterium]MBT7717482.1 hypothetical protein [Candidatus Uhrbacteria bacterium]
MHHSHRTWFPYILIGLTVVLLLVVFAITNKSPQQGSEPILTTIEYQETIDQLLIDYYASDSDTYKIYESLLGLRVQEDQKQVHLDLVLIFGKLLSGEIESINGAIADLGADNPWLVE